jgi:hypothetical protein
MVNLIKVEIEGKLVNLTQGMDYMLYTLVKITQLKSWGMGQVVKCLCNKHKAQLRIVHFIVCTFWLKKIE